MPSGILWEGPSPIDGSPIVAIATDGTRNEKTGPMVQVWIIRTDIHPQDARATRADRAICGDCPFAGGAGCYVLINPMLSIFRKYRRGAYPRISAADLAGFKVRLGAYGDPALLPPDLVREIAAVSAGWTGYSHQWRDLRFAWAAGYLMASVETREGYEAAVAAGWRPFYAVSRREDAPSGAVECPADSRGKTCFECGLCDGTRQGRRAKVRPIWIQIHGSAPVVRRALAAVASATL